MLKKSDKIDFSENQPNPFNNRSVKKSIKKLIFERILPELTALNISKFVHQIKIFFDFLKKILKLSF